MLIGATLPQAAAWTGGTLIGVLGGSALADPGALGLDAMFPAFFAVLLAGEARGKLPLTAAALGAVIALALMPFAPPGVRPVARPRLACARAACGLRGAAVAERGRARTASSPPGRRHERRLAHDRRAHRRHVRHEVVGPLVLGERPPGERMLAMTGLVAPALLAALVLYETFSAHGHGITLDARAAGLGAALVAILAARPDARRRARRGRRDGGRARV